ncbi:AraC family transcriptional regulator [Pseudoxanthomonas winnipegensis]|uniref:AraC family transcriptional regulator n=1 Tax=Pseudoxanthomonas winnipegensis TaxID=2480810 RepID=A0A4Q8LAU5_9GAMM|nr:AraC family transcriptional regulator [Pseudoxanthomonas winnipegensis]TAA25737.1 AraC family transcriptional regulator [Pseudoxanthomonas winnipegensis]
MIRVPSPPDASAAGLLPLAPLVQALAPREGYTLTALESVRLLRSDRPLARTPVLYDPGIVIVCQGRKRGYFGQRIYVYDAHQYLAVSVPVPFTMETDATAQAPLLALYLHLDFPLAAELMLEIDRHGGPPRTAAPQSLLSSPIDPPLHQAVQRLLLALATPMEAAILGPQQLRELYYRLLTGPQGPTLRAALAMQGRFGRIGKALRHLHAAYAQPLTVAQLAEEAGMSAPSFHSHFKAVTCTSPMQYLKSTRLHQARLLMVREGMTAAAACHAVGYESPSQFNREFKRLFGLTPAREVQRMRDSFAVPPKQAVAEYVSSH